MVPVRTCIGCRKTAPKNEMIRIVRSADGAIYIDEESIKPGRGAYVCRDVNCVEKMYKRRALNRAFRTEAGPEAYERIRQTLTDTLAESKG